MYCRENAQASDDNDPNARDSVLPVDPAKEGQPEEMASNNEPREIEYFFIDNGVLIPWEEKVMYDMFLETHPYLYQP